MRMKWFLGLLIILAFSIFFSGCDGIVLQPASQPVNVAEISTQAAQTVVANYAETESANTLHDTQVAQTESAHIEQAVRTIEARMTSTVPTAIPTAILVTPPFPIPTNTQIPPTFTPTITPTIIPSNCDRADFLGDYSPYSSGILYPGQVFRKVWRFQNVGGCTWTPDYRLVMVQGAYQGGVSVPIPSYVRPGQTVDLTFTLVAPTLPGNYIGYWYLQNAADQYFGIGPNGEGPLTIQVTVLQTGTSVSYDFASNYCAADWKSKRGSVPCQGNENEARGQVAYIDFPELENGYNPGPAIWMHPDESNNGWISGSFPAILIQPGDHFRSQIGCLAGSVNCDILMQIEYELSNNTVLTLGQWHETYDKQLTTLDLDLSTLAGQYVKFIFTVTVQNNQTADADGVWVYPRTGP